MIDKNDQFLFRRDVPAYMRKRWGGRLIHISTVYRWINPGIRGVQLEHGRLAGKGRFTSSEAIGRFCEALAWGPEPAQPATRASGRRQDRAREVLEDAGIG